MPLSFRNSEFHLAWPSPHLTSPRLAHNAAGEPAAAKKPRPGPAATGKLEDAAAAVVTSAMAAAAAAGMVPDSEDQVLAEVRQSTTLWHVE